MKPRKNLPLGYRDTDLEQRILLNTYKNKGITSEKNKVTTNMLKRGYSIEDICAITNLSLENVEKLKIKFSK